MCSLIIERSKLLIIGTLTTILAIFFLLKYAHIYTIAKIIIFGLVIIFLLYLLYSTEFNSIRGKCDILFDINNIVCWEQNKVKLMSIKSWQPIGNVCLIIRLSDKDKIKNLLLFRDSCKRSTFNELMRYARWKPLNKI